MAIKEETEESCGSRAVVASVAKENPRQHRMKLEVYGEVLQRIQESNYEEANFPDFDDQLWLHFNRLPAREIMVEIEKSLVRVRNFACTNRIYLSAMAVATLAVTFLGFFIGIYNRGYLIWLIGIGVSLLVLSCCISIWVIVRRRDIWQIRVNIPKRVVKYPCCRAAMNEFVKIVALATSVVFLIHLIEDYKKSVIGIVVFCVAFYLFLLTFMVVCGFTEGFDLAAAFLAASFVILYRECNGRIYLIAILVVGTCLLGAFKGLVLHGVEELGIGRLVEDGVEDGVEVEV